MITINREAQKIKITLDGNAENLQKLHRELFNLLQPFNYERMQADELVMLHVFKLLEEILPEYEDRKITAEELEEFENLFKSARLATREEVEESRKASENSRVLTREEVELIERVNCQLNLLKEIIQDINDGD